MSSAEPEAHPVMPEDFDLRALHAALDAERVKRGLGWAAIGEELGVSAATLRGFGERRTAEGDGVLRAVAWLGRSPESFVPGRQLATAGERLPEGLAARTLRFDARALYEALDAERAARGLTWREAAAASGAGSGAALTRLREGGRITFPEVMRVLAWLGQPAARFVKTPQG